ncbi:MAG: glycosyltransferase family 2 protein [Phycisphaerales bacterium]|nr:glycosyltransferase family 2 protein [Phycisphaerales bacterium]
MMSPAQSPRILLSIPVYNEARHIDRVLSEVRQYADHVLVIDDGSTDETPRLLARHSVEVIRHAENRGYGRSMQDMFRWARFDGFDWLITMDCDEQHEPQSIPAFMAQIAEGKSDVISGSRYLRSDMRTDEPPPERRRINHDLTESLNRRLGLSITDAFCGFKAYRVSALTDLDLDVDGYDFPMQFWVQAVANKLKVSEIPIRLIYNDPSRTFGGPLDDATNRLAVYESTLEREIERCLDRLPATAGTLDLTTS